MAPYFEQYTSALRRGIEKSITQEDNAIENVQAKIDELSKQIDNLQGQRSTKEEKTKQLTKSLNVFDNLPEVNILVPGPENGPVALADFAIQATQERLQATTEDSQRSVDKTLQFLFQINQIFNDSGIDTTRRISLDPKDDIQIDNDSLSKENEIQINGRVITLSPREKGVYTVLEQHEGNRINHRDISNLVPNMSIQQIGMIISSLRRKIEDDPHNPKHIIGKRGGYGVGGITFIKTPA